MNEWIRKTAISSVDSGRIRLRGYPIEALIGNISWAAASYLLLVGRIPEARVARLFEAILVSVIDHGPTPPSTMTACTVASTGAPLSSSVAAGVLAIAKSHGGAIEDCMDILSSCVKLEKDPISAANEVVRDFLARGARIAGLGHRLHEADPRTTRLFELANELGLSGNYVRHALALERVLSDVTGKRIPINADGAIAALLSEIEFPSAAANGIFIMSRVPGLIAHALEEQTRNPPLRPLSPSAYEYDGPIEQKLQDLDKHHKEQSNSCETRKI